MVDFIKAIERPFTDFKKFMLGLLFSLIPIVNFIAAGYELECGRLASKKQFKLPEWGGYGKLFIKGLLQFCISLIYLMIPVVLFLIGFWGGFATLFSGNPDAGLIIAVLISNWILILVSVLLFILAAYVSYSAIVNFAIKGRFKDGFSVDVWKRAFTWRYFMVIFIGVVYMALWMLLLSFIPYVGGVVAGFVGGVTIFTLLGQVYSEIR